MSMVSVGTGAIAGAVADGRPRRSLVRGPRFIVEIFDGADDALAALDAIQRGLVSTPFQSLNWLTLLYEELAPSQGAMPRLVVVTERNTGDVALVLPLLIKKKRRLTVARFADLGFASCGAPILGPAPLIKTRSIRRVWRAVRAALQDVDLIRLERMPAAIGTTRNPLLTRSGIAPARHSGNVLHMTGSFDDYLAGRDKDFRRDVGRCRRLLEREGTVTCRRVTKPEDIAHIFSVLEEQQQARCTAKSRRYRCDEPAQRAFFERLAIDGTEAGLSYLYALEVDGLVVATALGIRQGDTFAFLRHSWSAEGWSNISPGRLVLLDAIKDLTSRGVRHFDLGLRDKGFKRRLGAEEIMLQDLIVARDLAALPRATFHRVKGKVRKNARMRLWSRRFRRLFGH